MLRAKRWIATACCTGIAVLVGTGASAASSAVRPVGVEPPGAAPSLARAAAGLGAALGFVENRGQTDARVRYLLQGDRYAVFVTRVEVMLALMKGGKRSGAHELGLALRFVHPNPAAVPEGVEPQAGRVNYLEGTDRARWARGLSHYGRVVY